ncbi:MAG: RTX toxin-related calcium-binding protein (peptidase M10 serralysin domains), partial [Candidatus Campylobacter infans]
MANIYKGLDLDITLGNNLSSFIGVGKDIGEAQRGNISIGLGIDLAKFGHSIAEGAVKTFELSAKPLPAIGAGVSLVSLSNNLNKVQDKKDKDKTITDEDILNVISDTTGLIASAAGTAAVLGATAAAGVAVGLGVISVGTGIIAYGMRDSTAISDGVSAMNKAFSEIADTLGAAYDKALESVSGALDKAFDSIMSGRKLPSADYTDLVNKLHEINTKMSNNGDTLNISLYDPIALDLNNNGKIDTLSLENGVFFDHNGDKIAFKSSWVNSSDGILARDIDGDGAITSGAELFGN